MADSEKASFSVQQQVYLGVSGCLFSLCTIVKYVMHAACMQRARVRGIVKKTVKKPSIFLLT